MFIDISEIISTRGKKQDFAPELDRECLDYEGASYPIEPGYRVDIHAMNAGRSTVRMNGEIHLILHMPCSRCLRDVSVPMDIDFERELAFDRIRSGDVEDLDEYNYIDGNLLDVDRFVRNELIVHLPMRVLCREDCRGLCPVCGKDLNEGDCGCDRTSADPRMSAIRDIFRKSKEV